MADGIRRRTFLGGVAASATCLPADCLDISVADDITRLNATHVAKVFAPATVMDVQSAVKAWNGPVSVRGAGFSMGGQTLETESLHLETGNLSGIVRLDVGRRLVRVKAGTRWRQLQEAIDPHALAVKIMQSYANFAIGGAISV